MGVNLERAVPYINELYRDDEADREAFIGKAELQNFGEVVGSDVARAMQLLIWLAKPQNILEIGTSIGYSAISMADVMKHYGGKVTTIKFDEQSALQAQKNFRDAGVAEMIEVKIGDARIIVPELKNSFDLIFQDVGDKGLYPVLLDDCVRLLKLEGLLLAEDTLLPFLDTDPSSLSVSEQRKRSRRKSSLEEFNIRVARHPELRSTLIPIGDGLTAAIKIK